MELCFLFISPHFSFKEQHYILFTTGPRTCSLLLLHAESQNNPLDILFPRIISWLEGCETLAMQGGAVQLHDLIFLRCGSLQIRFLSGATSLWSHLWVELGASSSCHCRDEQLPTYINIHSFSVDSTAFPINRRTVTFQVSHLGLTDVAGFFWTYC